MPPVFWVKDPGDTRWFEFDWSQFLAAGETITSSTISCDSHMTPVSNSATTTSVSIQVSGGTAGIESVITCNIHTSAGNIYEDQKTVVVSTRQS